MRGLSVLGRRPSPRRGHRVLEFCFGLPILSPAEQKQKLDVSRRVRAHHGPHHLRGHGRVLADLHDHPFSGMMNAARKVVFSRTMKTAEWANTSIAAGDTTDEIDKLRQGDDGHILVWGGVGFWRSLMRLDLIDEFQPGLVPLRRR